MPDADLASEADQDVQPERGDAQEADVDQQAELVAAERERRTGHQHDAEQQGDPAVARREDRRVFPIAAAVVAGWRKTRHQTRSIFLVPNRP
ncbi:hypothetical protein [Dankookia sp. P2]|uniref:hypothetical protein n=1 Tax=Dankookia sp. P2 TaxID=3423955 RepID=UPI003D66E018